MALWQFSARKAGDHYDVVYEVDPNDALLSFLDKKWLTDYKEGPLQEAELHEPVKRLKQHLLLGPVFGQKMVLCGSCDLEGHSGQVVDCVYLQVLDKFVLELEGRVEGWESFLGHAQN
jgi:hypothetical protein